MEREWVARGDESFVVEESDLTAVRFNRKAGGG